ncbi:MAG TPA: hypothetical protein VK660_00800 [Xanthomonadaceae bacterium]|jgi:hypothetical protein|nr:hypothetical protein [Xanthomonadaceae bacterium]
MTVPSSAHRIAALWGVATGLIACLALSACTSEPQKPNPPEPVERFITNITPEGAKQFTYDLAVQSPRSGSGSGHSGGGHGGMGGGHGGGHHQNSNSDQGTDNGQTQMASKVRDRMEVKLKETRFCAAGYNELGTNQDSGHFQISGQCKDPATPEDRVHFPNTGAGV